MKNRLSSAQCCYVGVLANKDRVGAVVEVSVDGRVRVLRNATQVFRQYPTRYRILRAQIIFVKTPGHWLWNGVLIYNWRVVRIIIAIELIKPTATGRVGVVEHRRADALLNEVGAPTIKKVESTLYGDLVVYAYLSRGYSLPNNK